MPISLRSKPFWCVQTKDEGWPVTKPTDIDLLFLLWWDSQTRTLGLWWCLPSGGSVIRQVRESQKTSSPPCCSYSCWIQKWLSALTFVLLRCVFLSSSGCPWPHELYAFTPRILGLQVCPLTPSSRNAIYLRWYSLNSCRHFLLQFWVHLIQSLIHSSCSVIYFLLFDLSPPLPLFWHYSHLYKIIEFWNKACPYKSHNNPPMAHFPEEIIETQFLFFLTL